MTHYIYGLHLEGDDEIRYIGSTVNMTNRLHSHLGGGTGGGAEKVAWVEENKQCVRMKLLAVVENDPKGAERATIAQFSQKGHRLLNCRRPRRSTHAERESALKGWFRQHPE